jgi:hypothetical protein
MAKYLDSSSMLDLIESVKKIKQIRNEIYNKYEIDIIENDAISLVSFYEIIKNIDPNYICNFSRNGEDGRTILNDKEVHIENKCSKILKGNSSFAFHARGKINHEIYLFNVWNKSTLLPMRCYYVRNPDNVLILNNKLKFLAEKWEKKPVTKNGYDVIRIEESLLKKMIETKLDVFGCEVNYL